MAGGAETVADAPIGIPGEEERGRRRGGEEEGEKGKKRERRGGEKRGREEEEKQRGERREWESDENNDMLRACTMVTYEPINLLSLTRLRTSIRVSFNTFIGL